MFSFFPNWAAKCQQPYGSTHILSLDIFRLFRHSSQTHQWQKVQSQNKMLFSSFFPWDRLKSVGHRSRHVDWRMMVYINPKWSFVAKFSNHQDQLSFIKTCVFLSLLLLPWIRKKHDWCRGWGPAGHPGGHNDTSYCGQEEMLSNNNLELDKLLIWVWTGKYILSLVPRKYM